MKHKHHIVPRHSGGSDDTSNLIELTVKEHAEAHLQLFNQHGNELDLIAYKALSGLIDKEEARRLAVSVSLKGVPKTKEHREKLSIARKARGGITTGMKLPAATDERKRKISKANRGGKGRPLPHTDETKTLMSDSAKNRKKFKCSTCNIEMQLANLSRYHGINGEKCKLFTSPE